MLGAGFTLLRSKGSHRIYSKGALKVTVPFHSGTDLHPKIVKQVLETIEAGSCVAGGPYREESRRRAAARERLKTQAGRKSLPQWLLLAGGGA